MITQKASPKKIGPFQGVLIVLGIVLLLVLATIGMNLVNQRVSDPIWGQLAVLALAGMGVYYLMRGWILEFQYTVNGNSFFIERLYGQRTKVMLEVRLEDILFVGTDKDAAAKWPEARVMVNATLSHPQEGTPDKTCFAYRNKGQVQFGLIHANDEIKAAMFDLEKRKERAKDKWGE